MLSNNSTRPSSLTQLISPTNSIDKPHLATTRLGIDLGGPLPTAQGNLHFAVVIVEYFTKWIEAKPLTSITSKTI